MNNSSCDSEHREIHMLVAITRIYNWVLCMISGNTFDINIRITTPVKLTGLQFYFKIPTSCYISFHTDVMTFAMITKRII